MLKFSRIFKVLLQFCSSYRKIKTIHFKVDFYVIAVGLLYWINIILSLPLSFYSVNKLIGTRYSDFESNAVKSSNTC